MVEVEVELGKTYNRDVMARVAHKCANQASPARKVKMGMKRGVGYCMHVGSREDQTCDDYAKGVFLLNHGDTFYCPRCRKLGTVVKERGFPEAGYGDAPFKEVRVEFNYDPIGERYQEIAIVRDESIWGTGSKYSLLSPLIKTEKRALKVAESLLANLQRYSNSFDNDDIPQTTEILISFDVALPEFSRKMKSLSKEWENSTLIQSKQDLPKQEQHVGLLEGT